MGRRDHRLTLKRPADDNILDFDKGKFLSITIRCDSGHNAENVDAELFPLQKTKVL